MFRNVSTWILEILTVMKLRPLSTPRDPPSTSQENFTTSLLSIFTLMKVP